MLQTVLPASQGAKQTGLSDFLVLRDGRHFLSLTARPRAAAELLRHLECSDCESEWLLLPR